MDEQRYGSLLAEARPRVIETPEEHEQMLALAESIMEKGESLPEEEERLLALTVLLIEAYEISNTTEDEEGEEAEAVEAPPSAHVALQRLMSGYGMEVDDVAPIFGNPHLAREAMEGKREITPRQAKELAKLFRVSPKLFAPGD